MKAWWENADRQPVTKVKFWKECGVGEEGEEKRSE
jgi:hypothetical protein